MKRSVTSIVLSSDARVRLDLFDVNGRRLASHPPKWFDASGSHEFLWDAGEHPAGVYVVRLESVGMIESRKVVLAE